MKDEKELTLPDLEPREPVAYPRHPPRPAEVKRAPVFLYNQPEEDEEA